MLITAKIQRSDNQNRDKRRTVTKDKSKKQESFTKVLAKELTETPLKQT